MPGLKTLYVQKQYDMAGIILLDNIVAKHTSLLKSNFQASQPSSLQVNPLLYRYLASHLL